MGKLTALEVKRARHPGGNQRPARVADGNGLYLQITLGGAKSWLYRYRAPGSGRIREMGLGSAEAVTLAEARRLADDAKRLQRDGQDPLAARHTAQATRREVPTFRDLAESVIAQKAPGWKSAKHAAQWRATLDAHAYPLIGALPVDKVETEQVLAVLSPLWKRTPETASRLRQRIEAVLAAAAALGHRDRGRVNPATWRGHLQALLPAPRKLKPVTHFPALPWRDAASFYAALCGRDGMAALAVRFTMLTAQRSGAVRLACWREIDVDMATWTAPAAHMKGAKPHRVPLTPEMLAILETVRPLARGPASVVFPGRGGKPLSDMALSMLVRGMSVDRLPEGALPRWRDEAGRAVVVHGLRSTFRDWSRAHGVDEHVAEAALAHTDKDRVRAAYARSDLLDKRRVVMAEWCAFCASKAGNQPHEHVAEDDCHTWTEEISA
jgi:integrase